MTSTLVNRMMHNDRRLWWNGPGGWNGTRGGGRAPEYQEMVERLGKGESYESVMPEMQKKILGGTLRMGPVRSPPWEGKTRHHAGLRIPLRFMPE